MTYAYPEGHEGNVKTWEANGLTFSIIKGSGYSSHYCGYVRLPANPFKHNKRVDTMPGSGREYTIEYDGIVGYVPAHGGITYGRSDDDGSIVFGFDCNHYGDEDRWELTSVDWLTSHCEDIGRWVQIAATFEDRYVAAESNEDKGAVLDEMHEAFGVGFGQNNDIMRTFMVMGGRL